MRSTVTLWLAIVALWSGAGWANDSGVVSFQSAGSLQRSVTSEPFALVGTSVALSGELLFPEGAGPFRLLCSRTAARGIAMSSLSGGRSCARPDMPRLTSTASAGAALTRSAPSPLRSAAAACVRHLRRAASACRASESRREAGGADGFFPRRHRHHARVDNLGQGELRARRPALIPRLLRLLPILQHDISGAGSRIGASAHPYRRRRRLDAGETLR